MRTASINVQVCQMEHVPITKTQGTSVTGYQVMDAKNGITVYVLARPRRCTTSLINNNDRTYICNTCSEDALDLFNAKKIP